MAMLGQTLIFIGILLAMLGAVLVFAPHIPFLGRLPGDISFQTGNVKVYVPIATSILLSLVLTILLNLLARR